MENTFILFSTLDISRFLNNAEHRLVEGKNYYLCRGNKSNLSDIIVDLEGLKDLLVKSLLTDSFIEEWKIAERTYPNPDTDRGAVMSRAYYAFLDAYLLDLFSCVSLVSTFCEDIFIFKLRIHGTYNKFNKTKKLNVSIIRQYDNMKECSYYSDVDFSSLDAYLSTYNKNNPFVI